MIFWFILIIVFFTIIHLFLRYTELEDISNCKKYLTDPYCYSRKNCPERKIPNYTISGPGIGRISRKNILNSCRVKRQLETPQFKAIRNEIKKHGKCVIDEETNIIYITSEKEK